jgi:hypothetical protein
LLDELCYHDNEWLKSTRVANAGIFVQDLKDPTIVSHRCWLWTGDLGQCPQLLQDDRMILPKVSRVIIENISMNGDELVSLACSLVEVNELPRDRQKYLISGWSITSEGAIKSKTDILLLRYLAAVRVAITESLCELDAELYVL